MTVQNSKIYFVSKPFIWTAKSCRKKQTKVARRRTRTYAIYVAVVYFNARVYPSGGTESAQVLKTMKASRLKRKSPETKMDSTKLPGT